MAKLIINEIDCYEGNAHNIPSLATDNATQHQILLQVGEETFSIGYMGGVADDERGERIVKSVEVSDKVIALFQKANDLLKLKKENSCNSPIFDEVDNIIEQIYQIENLGLYSDVFKSTLYWY